MKGQELKLRVTVAMQSMVFHHRVIESTEKIKIWVSSGCYKSDQSFNTGFHRVNL
jgi:hypothetical protein